MDSSTAKASPRTERPKRILLAEDDAAFRSFLADVLKAEGHVVIEVCDGQQLLEKVASAVADDSQSKGVDLILSDVRMPRFDALEVAASLRSAEIELPILLMTAFGDRELHQEARQLGVLSVLNKPFEVNALRTAVRAALLGS